MSGPKKAPEVAAPAAPETAVMPDPGTADAEAKAKADAEAEAKAKADAEAADAQVAAEDEVTVVMNIWISGLRNGEAWPAPGGEITLPAQEAEQYIALGYASKPE